MERDLEREKNLQRYYETVSGELTSIKNRVRNLINKGNRTNWGEEGRYKEAILARVIRRMIPQNFSVGNGFVLCEDKVTTQIDIIVYDNSYPLLFSEGSFIITLPESVRGIIEVKTNLANALRKKKTNLEEIMKKITQNAELINKRTYNRIQHNGIFRGLFSFEGYPRNYHYFIKRFQDFLKNSSIPSEQKDIDCLTINENLFVDNGKSNTDVVYTMYKLEKLSYPRFIGKLIIKTIENTVGSTSKVDDTFFPPFGESDVILKRFPRIKHRA